MLLNLRKRMSKIRVFDPACGSGNFLVIADKDMRAIEAEINRRRGESPMIYFTRHSTRHRSTLKPLGARHNICGNPPYLGSKWQSNQQKSDLAAVLKDGSTVGSRWTMWLVSASASERAWEAASRLENNKRPRRRMSGCRWNRSAFWSWRSTENQLLSLI